MRATALPFTIRRDHGAVSGRGITSTRERLHGLLSLEGERLVLQWRVEREVTRLGLGIETDLESEPIREVSIPLSDLSGVRTRRSWRGWRFEKVLVLTAGDLRAFDELRANAPPPGLSSAHPAELVLNVRRPNHSEAERFVSALRLDLSERLLAAYDPAPPVPLLDDPAASLDTNETSAARRRLRT